MFRLHCPYEKQCQTELSSDFLSRGYVLICPAFKRTELRNKLLYCIAVKRSKTDFSYQCGVHYFTAVCFTPRITLLGLGMRVVPLYSKTLKESRHLSCILIVLFVFLEIRKTANSFRISAKAVIWRFLDNV